MIYTRSRQALTIKTLSLLQSLRVAWKRLVCLAACGTGNEIMHTEFPQERGWPLAETFVVWRVLRIRGHIDISSP